MTRSLFMQLQRLAVLFAVTISFAGAAYAQASSTPEWKTQSFPQDRFRVTSPVQLEAHSETVDTDGGKVAVSTYSGDYFESSLLILICDCVDKSALANPKKALEDAQKNGMDATHAHVISKKELVLDGHPGLEVDSTNEDRSFAVRAYLVGQKIYTITVAFPNGHAGSWVNAARFLDSFEFTPRSGK